MHFQIHKKGSILRDSKKTIPHKKGRGIFCIKKGALIAHVLNVSSIIVNILNICFLNQVTSFLIQYRHDNL